MNVKDSYSLSQLFHTVTSDHFQEKMNTNDYIVELNYCTVIFKNLKIPITILPSYNNHIFPLFVTARSTFFTYDLNPFQESKNTSTKIPIIDLNYFTPS